MYEWIQILKAMRIEKTLKIEMQKEKEEEKKEELKSKMNLLINSSNEIYGACRHKPKFHRFFKLNNLSADEGVNPEKSLYEENAKKEEKEKNTKKEKKKRERTSARTWLEKQKKNGTLICSPISV